MSVKSRYFATSKRNPAGPLGIPEGSPQPCPQGGLIYASKCVDLLA